MIQKFKQLNVGSGFDEQNGAGPVVSDLLRFTLLLAWRVALLHAMLPSSPSGDKAPDISSGDIKVMSLGRWARSPAFR